MHERNENNKTWWHWACTSVKFTSLARLTVIIMQAVTMGQDNTKQTWPQHQIIQWSLGSGSVGLSIFHCSIQKDEAWQKSHISVFQHLELLLTLRVSGSFIFSSFIIVICLPLVYDSYMYKTIFDSDHWPPYYLHAASANTVTSNHNNSQLSLSVLSLPVRSSYQNEQWAKFDRIRLSWAYLLLLKSRDLVSKMST